jgi:ferredoxin-NADP reductase
VARPGDRVEVRGPVSGFFAWPGDRPALLLGAGSGVVPLMSMVRHHRARRLTVPLRLLVSARSPGQLIFAREFGAETTPVFTRRAPAGQPVGRLSAAHLAPHVDHGPAGGWEAYVCGSNAFAEHASRLLVAAGQPVDRIRIERFG